MNNGEVYRKVEELGRQMEAGIADLIQRLGLKAVVARQGSAFCLYFMDHEPVDWHDLAGAHDFALDEKLRRELITAGIYFFPLATKQCSISFAHTPSDIGSTVAQIENSLNRLLTTPSFARSHSDSL